MTEYIARKMKVENLFKMGHVRASATIQLHPHATDIVTRNFFLRSLMFAFIASTCTRALADICASATLQLNKEAQPYEAVDTSQQFSNSTPSQSLEIQGKNVTTGNATNLLPSQSHGLPDETAIIFLIQ